MPTNNLALIQGIDSKLPIQYLTAISLPQPNGKVFNKLVLGDYHWLRYTDVDVHAQRFGRGIRELGVQPRDKICIFADTRAEWLISALGCFKNR